MASGSLSTLFVLLPKEDKMITSSPLDLLLNNQIIIPTLVSVAVASAIAFRDNNAEEDENFIRMKEQYRHLWSELANLDHGFLKKDVSDVKDEKARLLAFQMTEFFFMVWFLYFRRRSRYRGQWDQNMKHIFSHRLIKSALAKHKKVFDPNYVQFLIESVQVRL